MPSPDPSTSPSAGPGTVALTDKDPVDPARLGAWLVQQGLVASEAASSLAVGRFPGGHSNLTYRVVVGDAGAPEQQRRFILRAPPPGARAIAAGHDMVREHRVWTALQPHFSEAPTPLAVATDAETSPLGVPFFVMAERPGLILRHKPPVGVALPPARMAAISTAVVDTLARLHGVDASAPALAALGKPDGYVARQVEGWTARYAKARTDTVSDLEQIAVWLHDNIPGHSSGPPTVVHNDFKLDNVVLDEDEPTVVRGVLDWELCTIGEPLTDLGTTLAYWVHGDDGDDVKALPFGLTHLPGTLRRDEVVARWEAQTGRRADAVLFYFVLASFKVATIAQQLHDRWAQGHTKDPRFATLGFAAAVIGARAMRVLQAGHIDVA
jgi:aminoglycoside phosphotransferase (APT) family kinase protein